MKKILLTSFLILLCIHAWTESNAWGTGHGVFTYNLIHGLWGPICCEK